MGKEDMAHLCYRKNLNYFSNVTFTYNITLSQYIEHHIITYIFGTLLR